MTARVSELLTSFDQLTDEEKGYLLAEFQRRRGWSGHDGAYDDEGASGETMFLDMDDQELADK